MKSRMGSRMLQTVLLVLLLQLGVVAGAGLLVWITANPSVGRRLQLFLLGGTYLILVLAVGSAVMLGVRWSRQAEQGLREVHHRFRHLVDSIDGIIWEVDAVTCANLFVSQQAEAMLGYPLSEWYNDPMFWRKHLHPDDRDRMVRFYTEAEAKLQSFTAEYRMLRMDGTAVWIRDIISITGEEGRPLVIHGVMVDVTERKQFQEELERAFQEVQSREADLTNYKDHLEELVMKRSEALLRANTELRIAWEKAEEGNRMKSNFLSNMSHELRTPLNAIILYSDLIMDQAQGLELKETVEDLNKIQLAGRHLLSLIDDILDLSKIEAGRINLLSEEIDIPVMIQEITVNTAPMIGKNENRLIIDAKPGLQILQTDPTRLRQILINLLSNASKFTNHGTITLGVTEAPDGILFTVRDTGIGMTKEQLGRIFQRFTQADGSTTRKFGGTGLGLALSQRLAELLGGRMWAESEAGQGSAFHLILPRQMPDAGAADRISLKSATGV